MGKETLTVPKISCGHCVMAIQNELNELAGVKTVSGDPATKSITVEWDPPASPEKIRETLKEINYPAE